MTPCHGLRVVNVSVNVNGPMALRRTVLLVAVVVSAAASARPREWAEPLSRPGLPNLNRVDDGLYRGAQPTPQGFRKLAQMGVRTVVDLRLLHSDGKALEGTGLGYVHIPVPAWDVDLDDVLKFLKVVGDPGRRPVFVHCEHGADRTGTMVAIYRMVVQGWPREDAIREMEEGGFGFHPVWVNLPRFLRKLDIEAIGRAL